MILQFCGCRVQVGACVGNCQVWEKREKELVVGSKIFEIPFSDGSVTWNSATITKIRNHYQAEAQSPDGTHWVIDTDTLEIAEHGVFLVPAFGIELQAIADRK
jgi:hypothetical protein